MTVLSSSDRRNMWFGTEDSMRWIPTPQSGAEMGAEGSHSSGTLIGGGGFSQHSWGSHRLYDFEWPSSSSREAAQLMKSYRDGTYGRGLIYFIDPLTYDTNILPARWADPSMAIGDEGSTLVYGVDPVGLTTTGRDINDLPVRSAQYDLTSVPAGYRGIEDSLFIPIPEGMRLLLGAFYSSTETGGVYVTEVSSSGIESSPIRLSPIPAGADFVVNNSMSGIKGVRLWVGKTLPDSSKVVLTAMTARLTKAVAVEPGADEGFGMNPFGTDPFGGGGGSSESGTTIYGSGYGDAPYGVNPYGGGPHIEARGAFRGPWIGGMGHSGCKFESVPAYVANSGVAGGQIGYAVTLREVGSWIYG